MLRSLTSLVDLINNFLPDDAKQSSGDAEQSLRLATAVLLVEVMRADQNQTDLEKQAVLKDLAERFALPPDALEQLMVLAQDSARTAYDYQHFTSQINERFTHDQKIALVESLWRVAYSDAHLDAHENQVISKIAGLLYVTHGEYIAAKMRAKSPLDD